MFSKLSIGINLPYESVRSGLRLGSIFVAGQAVTQSLNLLSGFLLIRWLTVEDYAQYSLALAFQATAQILVEFGFMGAIVALVGSRIHDRQVVGNYIKAGKYYRFRFFILTGVLSLVCFPLLASQHSWGVLETVMLLGCILANLFFCGDISYYKAPLMMHKRLSIVYQLEARVGIFRLVSLAILHLGSLLNVVMAALTATIATVINADAYRRKGASYVDEPEVASANHRREMLAYIRPVMPGIVFTAFQSQIMVFIISIFGDSRAIADVAALGRLGQLFVLFSAAGTMLIGPYFARQPRKGLAKKFTLIVLATIGLAATGWLFAAAFPHLLITLIGEKYAHLQSEIPILILGSCLLLVNNIMWSIISSRKWLWWWMPVLNIGGVLVVQFCGVVLIDLSTTHGVLLLAVFVNLFMVVHKLIVSVYGIGTNGKRVPGCA